MISDTEKETNINWGSVPKVYATLKSDKNAWKVIDNLLRKIAEYSQQRLTDWRNDKVQRLINRQKSMVGLNNKISNALVLSWFE